jgi:hypothetical protein
MHKQITKSEFFQFKPEGEVDNIQFDYGHTCGEQTTPSIGIVTPDSKWRTRNSVMTHKQVDELILYLQYWQKKWQAKNSG